MESAMIAQKVIKSAALASLIALTSTTSALAFVDEFRFGGTWANPSWLEQNHPEGDQFGINAEVLFEAVNIDVLNLFEGTDSAFAQQLITPRPHFGGLANVDDDGTSYVYGGLTWQFELTEVFFIEAGFGMAYTNADENGGNGRAALGSDWQFHESIGIGANLTENLTAIVQLDHLSHTELFSDHNRGLSHASVRLGYKF